jgi:hypothetical protein
MPLARSKANSLSIPIPTAPFLRLRRPPTPRRATYPLCLVRNTPPVPALSFWDPEIPSPLSPTSPSVSSAGMLLSIKTDNSKQQDQVMSRTSATSSWYSHTEETTLSSEQAITPISPLRPRLLPPKSLYSNISPLSRTSPSSARLPFSPDAADTSKSSLLPYNPFLSPPVPRLTIKLFRLASPLLPASPLSIFDRAISPTSSTFLHSRAPSPGTPNQHFTFLTTATPSMADCDTWDGKSPTFLWPRTPPAIPHNDLAVPERYEGINSNHTLERCRSPSTAPSLSPPNRLDQHEDAETEDVRRKEMRIEFYHFLAAKRASALDRLSAPPWTKSEKSPRARGRKSRVVGGGPSRRRSFKARSGLGP